MAKEPNGTQLYRLEQLEKRYDDLDSKMDLILTNHLPHLHEAISSLKVRISVLTAFNIGAIIMGIIISRILQ